jgi:hypothetical protein
MKTFFIIICLLQFAAPFSHCESPSIIGVSKSFSGEYSLQTGQKFEIRFNPLLNNIELVTENLKHRLPRHFVVSRMLTGDNCAAFIISREREPGIYFYNYIMVLRFSNEGVTISQCAHETNLKEWKKRDDCGVAEILKVSDDMLRIQVAYSRYEAGPSPIDDQIVSWLIDQDVFVSQEDGVRRQKVDK